MTPLELHRAGRDQEALAMANAALGRDPGDEAAALAMGCALLALGRCADFHRLAAHVETARGGGRGWLMAAAALRELLAAGKAEPLIALAEAGPEDSPAHLLAVYHAGCALLGEGQTDAAILRFDWFRRHARFYAGHIPFAAHPLLNMIYRQGRLIAAGPEIETRQGLPLPAPALELLGRLDGAPPGQPALFTCVDDRYFRLMGEDFAAANAADNPATPIILHVIAPSIETEARLAAMAQARPGLFAASIERAPPFSTVTYYASARFFAAPSLMVAHSRPLISLDAELRSPVERLGLAQACAEVDFACFGTGRDEPGSVWQASVMWFGQTPASNQFLRALQAYCLPELGHPSLLTWQLDQAALLACGAWMGARLRFGDLRRILGVDLAEATRSLGPDAAKEDDKHDKMNAEIRRLGPALGELYATL